jgi:15-cis-phytoene synthase
MDISQPLAEYLPVPGSASYYATLFVPRPRKDGLAALLALKTELTRIYKFSSDPGVARIKLQWWQDELQRVCTKQPARHPIAKSIQSHCPGFFLHTHDLETLFQYLERELSNPVYASYAALREHIAGGTGRFLALTACLAEDTTRTAPLPDLIRLGITLELSASLQDLRTDRRLGPMRLPADEIPSEPLLSTATTNPDWQAFFQLHTQRLRDELDHDVRTVLAHKNPGTLHLLVQGAIQRAVLDEILRDGCRLLTHRIDLTPLRMLWLAWRTQRRLPGAVV